MIAATLQAQGVRVRRLTILFLALSGAAGAQPASHDAHHGHADEVHAATAQILP